MSGRYPTAAEIAQRETTAAAGFALQQLRAAGNVSVPALTITWRPMTEKPAGNATAMIRVTDPEGMALLPGPVVWSIVHQRWCDEDTMRPLGLNLPDVTYHWCPEHEITGGRP